MLLDWEVLSAIAVGSLLLAFLSYVLFAIGYVTVRGVRHLLRDN